MQARLKNICFWQEIKTSNNSFSLKALGGYILKNPDTIGVAIASYVTYQFGKWKTSSKPEEKEEPKIDLVPFPTGSPSVFHFHPTAFVEQMRRLGVAFLFPIQENNYSYVSHAGKFGASRKNGRLHAGCDLYTKVGAEVYAVKDGTVLCELQYFDLGTYQIVIDHGDFVCRYTELLNQEAPSTSKGCYVKQGQIIGYVGLTNVTKQPMLHFEMYNLKVTKQIEKMAANAIFSGSTNSYKRINCLINPTIYLKEAAIK